MKYPESIWRVPAYLPHVQPPLTQEALLAAETEIGFKLPKEYVDLLRIQNGGGIRWRLPDNVHNTIGGIGPNYPSLGVPDWKSYGGWLPFKVREGGRMVSFDGDGHWHLCLDYRKNKLRPSITLVDTEAVSEESIAASFADYLALLEPDVDERDFALPRLGNLEVFMGEISRGLGMLADQSSDVSDGYAEHRLTRKGGLQPECIWLSPNLVPSTVGAFLPKVMTKAEFLRKKSAPAAEESAVVVSEMAKRFPGLAEEAWILTISEEIIPEVLELLERLEIPVEPLQNCHGLI